MSDAHVEKVAEALWRAAGASPDDEWPTDCEFLDYLDYYRCQARAAVEALQLTEEWAVVVVYPPRDDYPGAVVRQAGPYAFQEAAEIDKRSRYSDDCYTIASRLVGPWREVGE